MYQLPQLAREQHRQMLAQASQRQRRHQHEYQAPASPGPVARLARRLTAAITRVGQAAAQPPDTIRPASPHPAAQAGTPSR
jgi:hypothetical protein